jgi:hypothetical protein
MDNNLAGGSKITSIVKEVFLDIETAPSQDDEFLAEVGAEIQATIEAEIGAVKAPGNYKDAIKIEEWMQTIGAGKIAAIQASAQAQIDAKVAVTSFDGALGCIAVIGYALNDAPPKAIYVDSTEPAKHEAEVLGDFFYALEDAIGHRGKPCFVGHNIANFDLRFMFQRAVVLGIRPPSFIPFHAKPWDETIFDTMIKWAGVGQRAKLDKICKALGLPGKQGIDGSMVAGLIRAGKISEVADYCANVDVAQTRQVYRRLTFADTVSAARAA